MKQLIELGAVRIGAAIQEVCASVDFGVLSLPGGSLIAVLLWFYASAVGSIRRTSTHVARIRGAPAENPRGEAGSRACLAVAGRTQDALTARPHRRRVEIVRSTLI